MMNPTTQTAKEAALAFDRAVVQHKLSSSKLNYPDGLPSDDEDYDEIMDPKKKRRLASNNTNSTGYTGMYKIGKRFYAQIRIDRKQKSLGGYDTAKEAALAFDRAVVQHKQPSSKLNYPDGLPIDDEDYDEIMDPKKKRKLKSNNTTGYRGVSKRKERFYAQIRIDGKMKYLGMHDTAKDAAIAFDRAVIQHKLPSSKLNFPNDYTTSSEDDESSAEESDASSSSSSSSDSCHSSDDDESDDEEDAVEPLASSQAQPHFEREPMLDRLVAEEQKKKQQQQQHQQKEEEQEEESSAEQKKKQEEHQQHQKVEGEQEEDSSKEQKKIQEEHQQHQIVEVEAAVVEEEQEEDSSHSDPDSFWL